VQQPPVLRNSSPLTGLGNRQISTKVVNPLNPVKLKRIPSDEKSQSNLETNDSDFGFDYKVIANMAYKTQAGINDEGMTKTNQDSTVVAEKLFGLENYNIFGVLDGHGKFKSLNNLGSNGHQVSSFINMHFCDFFRKKDNYLNKKLKTNTVDLKSEKAIYDKLKENNFEIVKSAFNSAEALLTKAKYDVNFSGSTSVLVLLLGNKIICANAGDSRAFLFREISKYWFNIGSLRR
jgi:hypothetical protein